MTSGRFPRSARLLKRSQYHLLSKNSHVFNGKVLFIAWKANDRSCARLGITVSKKWGDAHKRNRFKRRVREGFRLCTQREQTSVDIHVRPRGKIAFPPSFADVAEDFKSFFATLRC